MNTNSPSNNFELPVPQADHEDTSVEAGPSAKESVSRPESSGSKQSAQSVAVPKVNDAGNIASTNPQLPATQDDSGGSSSTPPATADDTDLIEKEWVVKAKHIVAATKDDPYKQNKELNRFRADYLKKRYHKDVKVEDA